MPDLATLSFHSFPLDIPRLTPSGEGGQLSAPGVFHPLRRRVSMPRRKYPLEVTFHLLIQATREFQSYSPGLREAGHRLSTVALADVIVVARAQYVPSKCPQFHLREMNVWSKLTCHHLP